MWRRRRRGEEGGGGGHEKGGGGGGGAEGNKEEQKEKGRGVGAREDSKRAVRQSIRKARKATKWATAASFS